MNTKYKWPRLLVIFAALLLIGPMFLPIWRIELTAPQYPEGLALQIYANAIAGDVDVINGLNHYIGMKTLHTEDFIEFKLLPFIIGGFAILGLLVAFINKRKLYYTYIATFILFGIVAMVDFYRWNYNYGHDLNPHAAIQVPGMAYQPPIIGYKQLLNFGAYSIPDKGGWLFIAAGVLLLAAYLLILKPKWLPFQPKKLAIAAIFIFALQACSVKPQPIAYGKDGCDHCKMTIMDKRFASEWVTDKGKVYRFDDVHCMLTFLKTNPGKGTAYVNDYNEKRELAAASELLFVRNEKFKSPMGGNIAAVTDARAAEQLAGPGGKTLNWQKLSANEK